MGTSPRHEALRELFSDFAAELAPVIANAIGVPVTTIEPVSTEQTRPRVEQLLPDTVLVLPDRNNPVHVVVVEVQLRVDAKKWRKWPVYVATAAEKFRCAADILVVAPEPEVASWARTGKRYGVSMQLRPCVVDDTVLATLGKQQIEADPVRAVAATIAHMDRPDMASHALETFEALAAWSGDPYGRLSDMLEAALPAALLAEIEDIMRTVDFEYKSEFARKVYARARQEMREEALREGLQEGRQEGLQEGRQEGLQEGRQEGQVLGCARTLLLVLETRGFIVDSQARERILAERDLEVLEDWTRQAVSAAHLSDVLGD